MSVEKELLMGSHMTSVQESPSQVRGQLPLHPGDREAGEWPKPTAGEGQASSRSKVSVDSFTRAPLGKSAADG